MTWTPCPAPPTDGRKQYGRVGPVMSLDRKPGESVLFAHPDHGCWADRAHASEFLLPGRIYTVRSVKVYSSSSTVELEEFPRVRFNTVMFMDWPTTAS